MPVPTEMKMTCAWPRAAPNLASAQALAFPSFSTTTGTPIMPSTLARNGSSRQARFGAKATVPAASFTNPAAPTPTALASCRLSSSAAASAMTAAVSSGLADGVDRLSFSTMRPWSSTAPAATLVPPASIPIVRLMQGPSGGIRPGITPRPLPCRARLTARPALRRAVPVVPPVFGRGPGPAGLLRRFALSVASGFRRRLCRAGLRRGPLRRRAGPACRAGPARAGLRRASLRRAGFGWAGLRRGCFGRAGFGWARLSRAGPGRASRSAPPAVAARRSPGRRQRRVEDVEGVLDHGAQRVTDRRYPGVPAGLGLPEQPRRPAQRAPRAFRCLIRWFGGGGFPHVTRWLLVFAECGADLAAHLAAHPARTGPDEPPLKLTDQVWARPTWLLCHLPSPPVTPESLRAPPDGPGSPERRSARFFSPFRAVSIMVFSALRLSSPGIGTRKSTARS